IRGRRLLWTAERPTEVTSLEVTFGDGQNLDFTGSPVAWVKEHGQVLRRRFDEPLADGASEHPVLADLRAAGYVDYLAVPLHFSDNEVSGSWGVPRQPGGFRDADIAAILALVPPLTRVAEIHTLRRRAVTLLNTYVGRQAGEHILAGQIRRGHTESLDAV